jgi:hypothetical protein
MKTLLKLIVVFAFLVPMELPAQFEQKFSLNFSIGLVNPFGESEYIESDIPGEFYDGTYAQPYPYLFSNFGAGAVFNGGVQVNYSRVFSMAFNIQFFNINKWTYEYEWNFMDDQSVVTGSPLDWEILESEIDPTGSPDVVVASGRNQLSMYNLAIGAMPKVYVLPGRMINPYLFAELSMNFTDLRFENNKANAEKKYGIESSDTDPVEDIIESSLGLGLYPGLGIDVSINENIALYAQSGFSYILINNEELEEAGYAAENFKTFKFELGMRFSFLRSKNL